MVDVEEESRFRTRAHCRVTSQNYTNTVTTCAQLNSTVVKITNIFENSYIGALLSGLNDQFPFIGVERKSNGTWVYQDASPLIYTNWAPGEPSLNSSLNCAYLGNSTLQWYATDCSTERPSFCSANEMPKESEQKLIAWHFREILRCDAIVIVGFWMDFLPHMVLIQSCFTPTE
ncbi:unnamed protein product, partial [Mesorhabditis belari]|uniref:C-type lectin domain-containing protein n=1 Tax=Mesorhabditis belari TaxID=2138241 RepID=A0AAF3EPQ1_9BILA